MRRSRLIAYLIALVALLTGALLFTTPGADADTANPEIAFEGWFARNKPPAAQADTCVPPTSTLAGTTTQPCGPTSPAAFPTPQSKATGAYVVASAGGDAGDASNTGGDTGWAAFQWDIFEQFGATVTKFEVVISQLNDSSGRNQGDTWQPGNAVPPIQACNILEGWASEPGSNPWDARPKASTACVVPTKVTDRLFTFDVTAFAQTWVDGTGFGFVIKPGTPTTKTGLSPFQITFSGYYDPGVSSPSCNSPTPIPNQPCTTTPRNVPAPKVTFAYTPAVEEDFGGGDDFGFGDFDAEDGDFFEETTIEDVDGIFAALPDLDIIPTDVGSEELPEDIAPVSGYETAAPTFTDGRRPRPISTDSGFPWVILLLLPLAAVAFWGTGTALGPLGDPVPARQGGVSRVLAARQAAHHAHSFEDTRY